MKSKAEKDHVAAYEKTVTRLVSEVQSKRMIAKRDFVIHQNDVHIEIKAGDDLSSVPEKYLENLKTESVI
jgi:hypothetical protein